MYMNLRRKIAKFLLRSTGTAGLVLKLYPLAVSLALGHKLKPRIEIIKSLLHLHHFANSRLLRIGDPNDGGYILDSNLESLDLCLSFGIGNNMRFEDEISGYVKRVLMFDHTIQTPILSNRNMTFLKKGLGLRSTSELFTLSEVLQLASPFTDAILKMDIEGAEVEILANFPADSLIFFRQITLELHGLHSIGKDKYFSTLVKCLENLNVNHSLISAHPNNWGKFVVVEGSPFPDVLELTYLRKNQHNTKTKEIEIIDLEPNSMAANNPLDSEISLNFISRIKYVSQ